MSVLEVENIGDVTTGAWTSTTSSDQRSPNTRRLGFEAFVGELETRAIERNAEFHATIVDRLGRTAELLEADSVLTD